MSGTQFLSVGSVTKLLRILVRARALAQEHGTAWTSVGIQNSLKRKKKNIVGP